MIVKKVSDGREFCSLQEKEARSFGLHTIGCVNWPEEFPSSPEVKFCIAHTGTEILLRFFIVEPCTRALVTEDDGEVWTDSCAEFFIAFDDTGYYNLECTCIGKALLGFRKEREVYELAGSAVMDSIERYPSLGHNNFTERFDLDWTLGIVMPASAFFRHRIKNLSGMEARANFFKCGDRLSEPHFLSWRPICSPKPDFHIEKFFGEIEFE